MDANRLFQFQFRGLAGVDITDIHEAKTGYYRMESYTYCANCIEGHSGVVVCFELSYNRKMIFIINQNGEIYFSMRWDGDWIKNLHKML